MSFKHPADVQVSILNLVRKLHQAVREDDSARTSSLINKGANVNAVFEDETAFTRAMMGKYFSAAGVIISSRRFNPNARNKYDRSPLFMAAKVGHGEFIKMLLYLGVDVNGADSKGNTPLFACAWYDKHECAEILLQNGANIDQLDATGQTSLLRACSNVSVNVVRVLLRYNCNVNCRNKENMTALMLALPSFYSFHLGNKKVSDMLEICKMLINAGCHINSQDDRGMTALHLAVESNNIYAICLLAENGCEMDLRNNQGLTPFHVAILPNKCFYGAGKYLLLYGSDVTLTMQLPNNSNPRTMSPMSLILKTRPTRRANKDAEKKFLVELMCKSVHPSSSLFQGYIPGENPDDTPDSDNDLHNLLENSVLLSVYSPSVSSLKDLSIRSLRRGLGSSNIFSKLKRLPFPPHEMKRFMFDFDLDKIPLPKLFLYITDGNNEKICELIAKGQIKNTHFEGKTPLSVAIDRNTVAARLILRHCRDIDLSNINALGDSVLHAMARYGQIILLDDVLAVFSQFECRNNCNQTPLQVAIQTGQFRAAALLIIRGATFTEGLDGIPFLHYAVASGIEDVSTILLNRGASANSRDRFNNTPLHVAASKGRQYIDNGIPLPAMYDEMVSANLDNFYMTLVGTLPRYPLAETGHANVIELLLTYGANINAVDANLHTPAECAELYEMEDLAAMLTAIH